MQGCFVRLVARAGATLSQCSGGTFPFGMNNVGLLALSLGFDFSFATDHGWPG